MGAAKECKTLAKNGRKKGSEAVWPGGLRGQKAFFFPYFGRFEFFGTRFGPGPGGSLPGQPAAFPPRGMFKQRPAQEILLQRPTGLLLTVRGGWIIRRESCISNHFACVSSTFKHQASFFGEDFWFFHNLIRINYRSFCIYNFLALKQENN